MKLIGEETVVDKIFRCETEKVEMTPKQKKQRDLWAFMFDLVRTRKHTKKRVLQLAYKDKKVTSITTAGREYDNMIQFYGRISIDNPKFYRELYAGWLEEIFHKTTRKKDFKNAIAALKEAAEIRGLKKIESTGPEWDKLIPQQVVINVSPEIQNMLMGILSLGAVNLSELRRSIDFKNKLSLSEKNAE